MKLKRMYILMAFLLSVVLNIVAFNVKLPEENFFDDRMMSASVANMFRVGDVETSLFTGKLNFSIPIYNIKDPDFNLDIALRYNSEGFKPRKHSGYVGYNWYLDAGGCITREVRGFPDEAYRFGQHPNYVVKGMYIFASEHQLDRDKVFAIDDELFTLCNDYYYSFDTCGHNINDYLPDIYHFSFCGYHGTFTINNKGEAVVISGDYVMVDLSHFLGRDSIALMDMPAPDQMSQITINTNDGYKYIFGGELASMEYSLRLSQRNTIADDQWAPAVNSWHLKQIIAPNQRVTNFYYKPAQETHAPGLAIDYMDNLWEYNEYFDLFNSQYTNTSRPDSLVPRGYNITKTSVLDSIIISGPHVLKAVFYNHVDSLSLYPSNKYSLARCNYMLDSIIVNSENRTLCRAVMGSEHQSYIYSGESHGHHWRFLTQVNISGTGAYRLTYNHSKDYPSLYLPHENNGAESDEYGYWIEDSKQGLLSQVVYPTGGKQTFTFEDNNVYKELRYESYNDSTVGLETIWSGGKKAGARIKRILTLNGNDTTEMKTFSYNQKNSNISSGVFFNKILIYYASDMGYPVYNNNFYSLIDTHVGYSYVEETTHIAATNEEYKTGYTFSICDNYYNSVHSTDINRRRILNDQTEYAIMSEMLAFDSRLQVTGKLMKVEHYLNNSVTESEQFVYNYIGNNGLIPDTYIPIWYSDTIVVFYSYWTVIARKLYVCPDVLVQTIKKTFHSNHELSTITNYIYDDKFRIKEKTITNSDSVVHFVRYKYPDEIQTNDVNSPYYWLKNNNMINDPLETVSGCITISQAEHITSGKINLYDIHGNTMVNPPVIENGLMVIRNNIIEPGYIPPYPYLCKTMELSLGISTDSYQPLLINGSSFSYDSRYKTTCEYDFNSYYRPTKIQPYGKMPTTYTWDGVYPTSKTTGNQTWHYTHIPYVGVSSATDPRGITTYYEYDSNGRLIEVYQINNGRKEILNAYQYNIKIEEPHD